MNCKEGDWAVFVKSSAKNLGRIVRVGALLGYRNWVGPHGEVTRDYAWEIDCEVSTFNGQKITIAPDRFLCPLRDSDGQDETLTWAPVPKKVKA